MRHGLSKHPIYMSWVDMRRRCNNPKRHNYKYYGARGIRVIGPLNEFPKFLAYVEKLPRYKKRAELKLSLDRINNDRNYTKGNLRWATQAQQKAKKN